jgi:hypothetical protein
MAISLNCTCGARLEIDDKFAGQTLPCPDCQRPLRVGAPAAPAPQDRPISGLALTSLILALVGAFTPISLAAIGVGYLALRQISRTPDRLSGLNFARAGMIVGAVGMFLTLAALASSEVLGLDALLREYRDAAGVDYHPTDGNYFKATLGKDEYVGLERPTSLWGRKKSDKDMLTLVNLREDAYLICLPFTAADDLAGARDKAAERLRQSELFKSLSRPSDAAHQTGPDAEAKPAPDGKEGDLILDVRLGRYDRTFLLRVVKQGAEFYLLAGGARKGRFDRLSDEMLRSLNSFKQIQLEN